jgi:hypothetical protein
MPEYTTEQAAAALRLSLARDEAAAASTVAGKLAADAAARRLRYRAGISDATRLPGELSEDEIKLLLEQETPAYVAAMTAPPPAMSAEQAEDELERMAYQAELDDLNRRFQVPE